MPDLSSPATDRRGDERLAVERRRILDVAWAYLARSGHDSLKVQLVARAAGVSMRRFYQHFDGKEALLVALEERQRAEATVLVRELTASGSPLERVEAWVTAVIGLRYGASAGPRARLLISLGSTAPLAGTDEAVDTALPLIDAIRDGKAAGVFPHARPEEDGRLIADLCSILDRHPVVAAPDRRDRDIAGVMSFVLRVLTHPEGSA
jgi:AcrR family transcriptional regulator